MDSSAFDSGRAGTVDNFVNMLPDELRQFVRFPSNETSIPYQQQNFAVTVGSSILACLLCPYAYCKMVLVREGEIALTWYGDEAQILGPGRYVLLSPTHHLQSVEPITKDFIRHGPIHIIRVQVGEIGFGVDTSSGKPVLLTHGEHVVISPTFVFHRIVRCSDEDINLEPYRLIRVNTGNIGFVYRQGELQILTTGQLHLIGPTDKFGGFLSLQQDVINLPVNPYDNCDYVPLIIKADVFYEICEPRKTIARISGNIEEIRKYIRESAVATLASIIRGSSLADIAQSGDPSYHQHTVAPISVVPQIYKEESEFFGAPPAKAMDANAPPPSAPSFQSSVHDQFMRTLATYFKNEFGLQLNNIRIESLALKDGGMREQLAGQAATSVQNQSALKNVENKRKLQEAEINMLTTKKAGEVRASKESEQIAVEIDAANMLRQARAAAEAQTIQAKASADAATIQAEGEAKSLEMIGKAKAESESLLIRLKGQAEAESAQLLDRTELGPRLALANVQANCLSKIEKIMYLPAGQAGDLPSMLTTIGLFQPKR